ncbi:MAG: hypothetical protein ACI8WB_000610 [Phenylobacterium sp.]|jgi:hypothetical protein
MSIQMNDKSSPSKEVLITMLGLALLEIRASDNLELTKALADIFHNLPPHLAFKWDEQSNVKAYEQIINKAQRYKLKNYIIALRKSAENSLVRDVGGT